MAKKFIKILPFVVSLALTGCGSNFNVDEYKSAVSEFNSTVNDSGVTIANYGNYISNYWQTINSFNTSSPGIKSDFDFDTAKDYADQWLEDKTGDNEETIVAKCAEIDTAYSSLPEVTTKDEDIVELSDLVEQLYNQYNELYDNVFNPATTVAEYTENVSGTLKDISATVEEISNITDAE